MIDTFELHGSDGTGDSNGCPATTIPTGSIQPMGTIGRRFLWVVVALAVVVAYGVIGYMLLEGWTFLDSLYMTATTLTTVGFREVRPLDAGGQVFTMSIMLLGVGLALVAVSLLATVVAESEFGGRSRRRRMERRIDEIKDHVIVCAYGRVGRAASRELASAGVPFIVIDPKEELVERMNDDGVAYIVDDPSNEDVLRRAGIERARGLICAVDSDATNVYITLIARSLNPMLPIVARASETRSAPRLEKAGADHVVSPYASSGRHMAWMTLRPELTGALDFSSLGQRSIDVEEVVANPGSSLVGRSVSELGGGGAVLALRRASGQVIVRPDDEERLQVDDVVLRLQAADNSASLSG
jgi:voltage-gated potassium channel